MGPWSFARVGAAVFAFVGMGSILASCGGDGASGGTAAPGGRAAEPVVELAAAEPGGTGERGSEQGLGPKIVKMGELGIRAADVHAAAARAQRVTVLVFGWWLLPALVGAIVAWRRRSMRPSPNPAA